MGKTIKFKKWCSERMGHPIGVELGRDAVQELELENKRLMEINEAMHKQVAGYLTGADWQHWHDFNKSKFEVMK